MSEKQKKLCLAAFVRAFILLLTIAILSVIRLPKLQLWDAGGDTGYIISPAFLDSFFSRAILTAFFLINAGGAVLFYKNRFLDEVTYVLVTLDALVLVMFVFLFGGAASPVLVLYPLQAGVTSVLSDRRKTWYTAALLIATCEICVWLQYFRIIPPPFFFSNQLVYSSYYMLFHAVMLPLCVLAVPILRQPPSLSLTTNTDDGAAPRRQRRRLAIRARTVLIVAAAVMFLFAGMPMRALIGVEILLCLFALLNFIAWRAMRSADAAATRESWTYALISLDMIVISFFVIVFGGLASPFMPVFPFVVIATQLLSDQKKTLFAAVLGTFFFIIVAILKSLQLAPAPILFRTILEGDNSYALMSIIFVTFSMLAVWASTNYSSFSRKTVS